ncbi:hypothetical protein DFH07DRAFT_949866 [Mycena maculata]|uniref:Uncharacterized protein n=1 Tax=Mycena maculata TaxID=230809 RepID=A0AAD7KD09_9AGAR|nr:hypothetical protein DFH07DRAFT_949866 [Mycena maculata]
MRKARNKYHSTIRWEKCAHWKDYITNLPHCNLYKAAKYTLNPGASSSSSRVPDLVNADGDVATTPAEKEAFFHAKFFPPEAPLPTPTFMVDHIKKAITKIAPLKRLLRFNGQNNATAKIPPIERLSYT